MNPILKNSAGHSFELHPWQCPICEPEHPRKKILGLRGGAKHHRYGLGIESTIVKCTQCGLLFPDPFPIPLNAQELYGDPDAYFQNPDEEKTIQELMPLLKGFSKYISNTPKPRILDVGCGRGLLLEACKRLGMSCTGLEFSDAMISHAKNKYNLDVAKESIEAHALNHKTQYDIVVLSAVLEHVYHPETMIHAAMELLKTGGLLYINVPNEPNLLTHVAALINRCRLSKTVVNLSPSWPPYHVYGFNPKSLKTLLEKNHFQIQKTYIYAGTSIPVKAGIKELLRFVGAKIVLILANLTKTAPNICIWATKTMKK